MSAAEGSVPLVRIYVSSPGDVAAEAQVAVNAVEKVLRAEFAGKASLETYSWDPERNIYPVRADRTPQDSVNALVRPADCHIVVTILWSRMGTPLPEDQFRKDDGQPYASGTEWEFENALQAAKKNGDFPRMLLYLKTDNPQMDVDLPDDEAAEVRQQRRRVKEFVGRLRDSTTGSIVGGVNEFAGDGFREMIEKHLRFEINRVLAALPGRGGEEREAGPALEWKGSPFPGLVPFTDVEAPIYAGREHDVDKLAKRVHEWPLVAVVAASGSGKSSLVGAGLVPRLSGSWGGQPWLVPHFDRDSGKWRGLHLTPGELQVDPEDSARSAPDPVVTFARRLAPLSEEDAAELAERLRRDPAGVSGSLDRALAGLPEGARCLVVVDQLEELFNAVHRERLEPFVALLKALVDSGRARVVLTVRADFMDRWVQLGELTKLLVEGRTFYLAAPTRDELRDMITNPAALTGLRFDDGLVKEILDDLGAEEGALPLLAHTLAQLYARRTPDGLITTQSYHDLGKVLGAIGAHAERVFNALDADAQEAFTTVFAELTKIDERGRVTGRRTELDVVAPDEGARRLVDALTAARLLHQAEGGAGRSVVKVAHEALFTSWPHLCDWVETRRQDLRVITSLESSAWEWNANNRAETYLWTGDRLTHVDEACQTLSPELDAVQSDFLQASRQKDLRDQEAHELDKLWRARSRNEGPTRLIKRSQMLFDNGPDREGHKSALLYAAISLQLRDSAEAAECIDEALQRLGEHIPALFEDHQYAVESLAVSPDGTSFISTDGGGLAVVHDVATGHAVAKLRHPPELIQVLLLTDEGETVTAGGSTTWFWKIQKHAGSPGQDAIVLEPYSVTPEAPGPWRSIAFHPARRQAAIAVRGSNVVQRWHVQEESTLPSIPHGKRVSAVAFAPQPDFQLLTGGEEGTFIWRLDGAITRQQIDDRPRESAAAWGKGACAVAGRRDVLVWSTTTLPDNRFPVLREFELEESTTSLQFSPDGEWLSATTPTTALVWKVRDEQKDPRYVRGGWVTSTAWSPDGRWFATAAEDHFVRVWDVTADMEIRRIQHPASVLSMVFTRDGGQLLTGDVEGHVRLWSVSRSRLLEAARHALGYTREKLDGYVASEDWLLDIESDTAPASEPKRRHPHTVLH